MSYAAGEEDERVGTSCETAEVDVLKLEEYHEHDEEESNERADELHDRKLFTRPDSSYHGECPLCFLPLQLDPSKSSFWTCCSSLICRGCLFAHYVSNMNDDRCPFCREPAKVEEMDKRVMKRVKANDPAAMCFIGKKTLYEGDLDGAIEYFTKAAELGNMDAHYQLGLMYHDGISVERDEEKSIYHYEMAAIGGHHIARIILALNEEDNGNMERAVKHYIIAANLGCDESMKALWKHYSDGNITKENLDATLRTHQAAIDAMKSEQRDAAEVAFKNYNN